MAYCRHTTTGCYFLRTWLCCKHGDIDDQHFNCLGCTIGGIEPGNVWRCFKTPRRALEHLRKHLAQGDKVKGAIKRLEREIKEWSR